MCCQKVNGAEKACLRYERVESSTGALLVVMSDQGVVDIVLGGTHAETLSSAVRRFPGTRFVPDRGAHSDWAAAVVRRLDRLREGVAFPIDLGPGHLLCAEA